MRSQRWRLAGGLVVAAALALVTSASPAGQADPKAIPRAPDGHPDLSGTYDTATLTELERPTAFGTNLFLTEEQAKRLADEEAARVHQRALPSNPNRDAPPVGGDGSTGAAGNVGGYNTFWIDRGTSHILVDGKFRTSIITSPENGRVPAMNAAGRARQAARFARPTSDTAENGGALGRGAYDDPEQRPLGERCLLGFGSTSGPPSLPVLYNNLKQIVQTPEYVMILVEMNHDARIIPLNKPHAPQAIRKWIGDSVGHWEGDTLVVDTTNFTDKTRFRGSSENLHVIERFSMTDKDTLLYQFTVEDPETWDRPWSGEYPWPRTADNIYEYACHEGNYALGDILRGERLLEKEAAAAGPTGR
jgi:hypothetical protein